MAGKDALLRNVVSEIREFCAANANEAQVRKYARFFTEGYDGYDIPKEIWEANPARYHEKYKDRLALKDFLELGDLLLESGKYEEGSFAITTIMPMLGQFTPDAFQHVGHWLESGVRNWAHSDVICGQVLAPCLEKGLAAVEDLSAWRDSGSKWKRRAVPVSLLAMIGAQKTALLLRFIEPLMLDSERVVHQGMGWFLRETWKKDPAPVERFLLKWKDKAPRLIYQYATEKMSPAGRQRFRRAKPKR